MLTHIIFDLDDTLLDFSAGEVTALSHALTEIGIVPTQEILIRYHAINQAHWRMLEEGRLTRAEVKRKRFEQLFQELGLPLSVEVICSRYEQQLALQHTLLPGAEALLKTLVTQYDLYLASNGSSAVQNARLDAAGIRPYFKRIFISEEIGANKPSPAFFRACFSAIPNFQAADAIIIGDSLTSDIQGGLQVGLRTIWFTPYGTPPQDNISPTYTIHSLEELPSLLAGLT